MPRSLTRASVGVVPNTPDAPSRLTTDQRRIWREIFEHAAPGLLTPSDVPMMVLLTETEQRRREALADPSAKPATIAALSKLVAGMLTSLHMTPASRNERNKAGRLAEQGGASVGDVLDWRKRVIG